MSIGISDVASFGIPNGLSLSTSLGILLVAKLGITDGMPLGS